jgi:hypothetical protein
MKRVPDAQASKALALFSTANLVVSLGLLIFVILLVAGKSLHLSSFFVTTTFNAFFLTGIILFASSIAVFSLEIILFLQRLVGMKPMRLLGWALLALAGLLAVAFHDLISILTRGFQFLS